MKETLDEFFGGFRFYRRWAGGTWCKIRFKYTTAWIRAEDADIDFEEVVATEEYPWRKTA